MFILCAALAALSTLTVMWLMPQLDLDRSDDEELKQEGRNVDGREKKVENE